MEIPKTGNVILIGGGSSSGKSSIVKQLKKIKSPPAMFHLDFDDQMKKLMQVKFDNDPLKSIEYLVSCLTEAAEKSSFFMDHWMPPRFEEDARKRLAQFKVFNVWVLCSSMGELKRREAIRTKQDDYRGDGVTEAGAKLPMSLTYDYTVDSYNKTPTKLAKLIHKKALRHWGYRLR